MDSQFLQFAGSLAAIAAVIALAHFLGFSRAGRIADEKEARALIALAPGGFDPVVLALDQSGRGAVAKDSAGRLAVLVPHGGQFIARVLDPDARLSARDGRLVIEAGEPGARPITINLGDSALEWADNR